MTCQLNDGGEKGESGGRVEGWREEWRGREGGWDGGRQGPSTKWEGQDHTAM